MNLRPEERTILYATYLKIAAAESQLTDLLYRRLFELDPSLQSLFKVTMKEQGIKWRMMLNIAIAALDHPALLEKSLREMGRRHVGYGVKEEDYPKFVDAVVWAIKQYLGPECTPEVESAWRNLFAVLVDYAIHEQKKDKV
jgi:hemoglobin-like flavoprotein